MPSPTDSPSNTATVPTLPLTATAWTADWLLAWLAAVGVTYRRPDVRLSWTDSPLPAAIFHGPKLEAIEDALPSHDELANLAIARESPGLDEFPRKPTRSQFAQRAGLARRTGDLSLGATVSSFRIDPKEDLVHSPLDPSVPKGVTLHQRVVAARAAIPDGESLVDSMLGRASTASINGLGFDLRRLSPSSVPGDNLVIDPIAETMAFFGLLMFTQWGNRTRGWRPPSAFRAGAFRWPTWPMALDWAGIDALLDRFIAGLPAPVDRVFASVAYQPTATADTTRGFGSTPVERSRV
ncbi:MAG: hypothetical protein ACK5RL_15715 [Acidimicrobiales bacterium]